MVGVRITVHDGRSELSFRRQACAVTIVKPGRVFVEWMGCVRMCVCVCAMCVYQYKSIKQANERAAKTIGGQALCDDNNTALPACLPSFTSKQADQQKRQINTEMKKAEAREHNSLLIAYLSRVDRFAVCRTIARGSHCRSLKEGVFPLQEQQ